MGACIFGVSHRYFGAIKGNSAASVFFHQLSAANIPLGPLAGHHSAHFFRRVLNKKTLDRPGNTVELYHEFRRFNFSDIVLQGSSCSFSTEAPQVQSQESITQTRGIIFLLLLKIHGEKANHSSVLDSF